MSSTIKVNNIQNLAGDDSGIDLSTNDQIILKTANTTAITVDSSQGVTLAGKLDVSSGTIKLDGNYPTGTDNVALGDTALGDGSLSGNYNTAIGKGALLSNTSGSSNTAVGRNAGNTTTTATDCVYIGKGSGTVTTGSNNSFLGSGTGSLITTGAKNTIIGRFNGNQGNLDIRASEGNVVLSDGDGQPCFRANGGDNPANKFYYPGINPSWGVGGARVNIMDRSGNMVQFLNTSSSIQGSITLSGSTVSYNAFSGSHWSRLTDNSKPTILKGTVIETIDEMCDWYGVEFDVDGITEKQMYNLQDGESVGDTITYSYEGNEYQATIYQEDDEKHTNCKVSDTADSTRVYGVFSAWDTDDDPFNDMYVTAVGTHVVRVNADETVSAGDLLTSNGDGTAKVQDDDIIRSKTIGKVLTNIKQETYDDGSYTVPCALYCG